MHNWLFIIQFTVKFLNCMSHNSFHASSSLQSNLDCLSLRQSTTVVLLSVYVRFGSWFLWNHQRFTVVYKSFAGSILVQVPCEVLSRYTPHCSLKVSVIFSYFFSFTSEEQKLSDFICGDFSGHMWKQSKCKVCHLVSEADKSKEVRVL